MTLDALPLDQPARISSIDWAVLAEDEGKRLRALGVDVGARVEVAHRGVFGGRDPVAVRLGTMTVALRRVHAAAMTVEPL